MAVRKPYNAVTHKPKPQIIIYKKPAAYKQPGEKSINLFDEVAKPPKIDLPPGTVLFVPPTKGSYLVRNTVGD